MDAKIIWSIVFVVFVILLGILKPNSGRIFLGIFYLVMAIGINLINAITDPLTTVKMGEESLLELYRVFFSKVVAQAPAFFILLIAAYQIAMGILILARHNSVKIGLIGTSIFLVLIAPFGYIQIPWLGIVAVQIYLLGKDFDKTLPELVRDWLVKKKKNAP